MPTTRPRIPQDSQRYEGTLACRIPPRHELGAIHLTDLVAERWYETLLTGLAIGSWEPSMTNSPRNAFDVVVNLPKAGAHSRQLGYLGARH